jgi:hypothetical protein
MRRGRGRRGPLGRAQAALRSRFFLAARFLTGQVIYVDGDGPAV